jgi:hypothetical protein
MGNRALRALDPLRGLASGIDLSIVRESDREQGRISRAEIFPNRQKFAARICPVAEILSILGPK